MSTHPSMWSLWREPGAKYYLGPCGGSLGLIFLLMTYCDADLWGAYLPLVVGTCGAVFAWERASAAFLATMALTLSVEPNRSLFNRPESGEWITELLLAAGTLGYVSGQYRLQGLLKSLFPTASKAGQEAAGTLVRKTEPPTSPRRAAQAVTPFEVGWLLLLLPIWAAVAMVVSALLPRSLANPGLVPGVWRVVTLVWLLSVTALVLAGVFDYYRRRHMARAEALLYLQDIVWTEMRGENRHVDRWRAWARRGGAQNKLGRFLDVVELIWEILVQLWLVSLIVGLSMAIYYFILVLQ